ncbi:hypothetical protein L211DRAFT_847318 [Terfezia boudieri ATCC MYA-4762]|uniref:Uncharacterized protein n=1 Tax=Terfezia boudieri ATCC MYA-4762 TaxID=1051890 RepID=A0A3N4LTB7_9PEZI|nr:hypothetical protein L211DRAFT_847318 [Terfezia boudieri ATCC MYA-4762]
MREEGGSQRPPYRPCMDIVCYNCRIQEHKFFECRSPNSFLCEEQDKLCNRQYAYNQQTTTMLNSTTTSTTSLNSTGHKIPQQVTFVDVPDKELGLVTHTDPEEMMMLSAKMVEIIQEEDIASSH